MRQQAGWKGSLGNEWLLSLRWAAASATTSASSACATSASASATGAAPQSWATGILVTLGARSKTDWYEPEEYISCVHFWLKWKPEWRENHWMVGKPWGSTKRHVKWPLEGEGSRCYWSGGQAENSKSWFLNAFAATRWQCAHHLCIPGNALMPWSRQGADKGRQGLGSEWTQLQKGAVPKHCSSYYIAAAFTCAVAKYCSLAPAL